VSDEEGILEFPSRPGGVPAELLEGVEALLFAAGEPLGIVPIAEALDADPVQIRMALRLVAQRRRESGVTLERIGAGWQLRTAPRFAGPIHRLLRTKPARLTRPGLEVLAIVAWKQPVTRTDVERTRGVDSGGVLKSLLDRGLVRTAGRATDPGRPLLYRTTQAFLELFSLPDLAALPTLEERASLVRGVSPHEEE
jgi:segregation and condensation protein B